MNVSTSVVAVWLAFASVAPAPAPTPAPQKCCGECGGTGMVWTGDRMARVHCPCPPTCPCAANRPRMGPKPTTPKTCNSGTCSVR